MDKQKTAFTQLIEWIDSFESSNIKPTPQNVKEKCWQLLTIEKRDLVDSFQDGREEEYQYHINSEPINYEDIQSAEQYYQTKYSEQYKNKKQ